MYLGEDLHVVSRDVSCPGNANIIPLVLYPLSGPIIRPPTITIQVHYRRVNLLVEYIEMGILSIYFISISTCVNVSVYCFIIV